MALIDLYAYCAMLSLIYMHLDAEPAVLKIHKTTTWIVALAANAWIWILYGLLQPKWHPIVTGFSFALLEDVFFIAKRYRTTDNKDELRKMIKGAGLVVAIVTAYACAGGYDYTGQTRSQVSQVLGYVGMLSMFAFLWEPLQNIKLAYKNRSYESIPVDAVGPSFANSMMWTVFSAMTDDWFLFVPSCCALILDAIQIGCVFAFPPHHEYLPIA